MPMAREEEEADPEQEGVRELLQAMEAKMRKLSDQRRTHNESARTNADKRDAVQKQYGSLRDEIKEILESQKEVRVKAKIHQARRDAIQEQLRNLFSRSKSAQSNKDKSVILQLSEKSAEAEQIEFRLERDGTLKLDAENRLHKKLKSLKNEIKELEPQVQSEMRIKIDISDLEGSIEKLKAEADEEHKQMVAFNEEADKIWEEVKPKFDERDFLKSEGDRLHDSFVQCRKDADAVHQQIEELMAQVTTARKELQGIKDERESWATLHNKSIDESTSTPQDDEKLADDLVSNLMGSGSLSLGGTAGLVTEESSRSNHRRKGRKTTLARRGNRGSSNKSE